MTRMEASIAWTVLAIVVQEPLRALVRSLIYAKKWLSRSSLGFLHAYRNIASNPHLVSS